MNESALRRVLLVIAILGLAVGVGVWKTGLGPLDAGTIWMAATLPVVAVLAISILRDFWIGRFGVDAIALVSMSAALLLGQPLAAVVVAIIYAGGTVLEDFARGRAERNLKALTDRSPRVAHRKSTQETETISVDEVAVGNELLVRAGELLPVDGILLDPSASLDESAVTGEPLSVRRIARDALRSGTLNAGEPFSMRASALAEQSTYAAIVRMVAAAQTAKAPFIRMADRFALVPAASHFASLRCRLVHFRRSDQSPGRAGGSRRPGRLSSLPPLPSSAAYRARRGILMKGSATLEALAQVRTAIFDKTGTLTVGGAELIEIETAPGSGADHLLQQLASLEQASHHVLADSIVRAARDRQLMRSHPRNVREYRGAGLTGRVENMSIAAGSRALVLADKPTPQRAQGGEERYRDKPVLRVFGALGKRLAGVLLSATPCVSMLAMHSAICARPASRAWSCLQVMTAWPRSAFPTCSTSMPSSPMLPPRTKSRRSRPKRRRAPTMMSATASTMRALAAATVGVVHGRSRATASSEAADVIALADRLEPVRRSADCPTNARIALQSIVVGLALSATARVAAAMAQITPVAGALLQEGIDVAVILNALRALGDGHLGRA